MADGLDSAIPFVGAGISALSGIASGIEEAVMAAKQRKEAASLRTQANSLAPTPIRPEFLQKLTADQLAALGDMPGYESIKDLLSQNTANLSRVARQVSPDGASTLAAVSGAIGNQNKTLLQAGINNAGYKAQLAGDVRNDFWNIGQQKRALEMDRDLKQQKMLNQAANLENAGSQNQLTGERTISGSIGAGAAGLTKTYTDMYNPESPTYVGKSADTYQTGIGLQPTNSGASTFWNSGMNGGNVIPTDLSAAGLAALQLQNQLQLGR